MRRAVIFCDERLPDQKISVRAAQIGTCGKDAIPVFQVKPAIILIRHLPDILQAEAMAGFIFFGGGEMGKFPLGIWHRCVFDGDRYVAAVSIEGDRDPAFLGTFLAFYGFHCVSQQVRQDDAEFSVIQKYPVREPSIDFKQGIIRKVFVKMTDYGICHRLVGHDIIYLLTEFRELFHIVF